MKALVHWDYQIIPIIGYKIINSNYFVKLFIQKTCRYILLCKQRPEAADVLLPAGLGASGNRVTSSLPRGAGPLTHNTMFHKNSFLLSLSLFPVAPTWSLEHPWNASFLFSFLILRQSVGLLGRGINPSQGRYLYKHRINTDKHPCLQWESNPWSHRLSGRRQFMP
jgi:hypothetical protein